MATNDNGNYLKNSALINSSRSEDAKRYNWREQEKYWRSQQTFWKYSMIISVAAILATAIVAIIKL